MQTITEVRDRVTETVKPVLDTAVEKTAPVLTSAIEHAIGVVERIDPEAQNREAYFGYKPVTDAALVSSNGAADGEDAAPQEERKSSEEPLNAAGQQQEEGSPTKDSVLNRLKVVTEDLLDLWLYEGSKGLDYIQASKAYMLTDPYVHYVDRFSSMKGRCVELSSQLEQLPKKVVLYYDEATNFVGMLIRVLNERQEELVAYVRRTYSNVQVFVQDNYLRLDFNQDGAVSMEDLRASLTQFYDFLKSYDYIEASSRISSNLYDQAVNMIKRDHQEQVAASRAAHEAEGTCAHTSEENKEGAVTTAQDDETTVHEVQEKLQKARQDEDEIGVDLQQTNQFDD